jgi:hypothetical protein
MRRMFAAALSLSIVLCAAVVHLAGAQAPTGSAVPYVDADGVNHGTVTIKEIDDPFTGFDPSQPAEAGSRYVEMIVVFESSDDQSFDAEPYYIVVRTTDGHLYSPSYVARPADAKYPVLQGQTMAPGNKISGALDFVLPSDAKIADVWFTPAGDQEIQLAAIDESAWPAVGAPFSFVDDDGSSVNMTVTPVDPATVVDPDQPAPDGSRYAAISAVFENKGDRPFDASPSYLYLLDTSGTLHYPSYLPLTSDPSVALLDGQTLNVGDRISGLVGYTIPTNAEVAAVLYYPRSDRAVTVALVGGGGTTTPSPAPSSAGEPTPGASPAFSLEPKPTASTAP